MTSPFLAQFEPLRRLANSAMADRCRITLDSASVDDDILNDDGSLTPAGAAAVIWEGPCQVVWLSPAGDAPSGGRQVGESNAQAFVPLECPAPPRGAILTVTAVDVRSDPALLDKRFTVRRAPAETITVQRQLLLSDGDHDDG